MNFQNIDIAMLIIRLVVGSTFILHGGQKLFGWLGGPGMQGWLGYLATLGITSHIIGYLAAAFEFVGGVMVLTGIGAELGAVMILVNMLAAICLVHSHGYFLPNGMEYALNLALLSLAIIFGGTGSYVIFNPFNLLK